MKHYCIDFLFFRILQVQFHYREYLQRSCIDCMTLYNLMGLLFLHIVIIFLNHFRIMIDSRNWSLFQISKVHSIPHIFVLLWRHLMFLCHCIKSHCSMKSLQFGSLEIWKYCCLHLKLFQFGEKFKYQD